MTEAARKSSAEGLKRLRHMPIGLGINREQSFLTRKAQHSKRDTHRVGRKVGGREDKSLRVCVYVWCGLQRGGGKP